MFCRLLYRIVPGLLLPLLGVAETTVFFSPNQVATQIATGTTSDTISGEGYIFTYTRDKLFTGGVGLTNPVGRFVTVNWPTGLQAQAVTTGPNLSKARITISRAGGGRFDLTALTFKLLANTAGAGGNLEIMPKVNGEDAFNDPLYFNATGLGGNQFTYTTAPNYLGCTATLTNYESYTLTLYVDYALTALTLATDLPPVNHAPTGVDLLNATVAENEPPGTSVGSLVAIDPDAADTHEFTLVSGSGDADNAAFTISGSELLIADYLNYEVQSNFTIRVAAADQDGLSTQQVFAVSVLDVDETPALQEPTIRPTQPTTRPTPPARCARSCSTR